MRSRLRGYRAPLAAVAAIALVTLSPVTASADDSTDPLGQLTDQVTTITDKLADASPAPTGDKALDPAQLPKLPAGSNTASTPSADAPAPSSDDDSAGNETTNPVRPDHGSAQGLEADVAHQDVADVASSEATVRDNDTTKADSTLLAIGGQEVLGSHADSNGTRESHFGDPLAPVCEGSGGAVCLTVLYADAVATDNGTTSHSTSRSGVADVCVGGDDTTPTGDCTAPIGASALTSEGQADRNQATGRTTAGSSSDAAHVCLSPDPFTGICALGVGALHSEGQSDSGGSASDADRGSYLLAFQGGGQELGRVDQPAAIAVQPECAAPSLLCAYLNQGETYLGSGIAGHAQDALKATVLPTTPLEVFAGAGHTETLVHNDGGSTTSGPGGNGDNDNGTGSVSGPGNASVSGPHNGAAGAGGPGHPGAGIVDAVAGALPNTGGFWSGLLTLGLFGIAAGAFTMALGRRRGQARAA